MDSERKRHKHGGRMVSTGRGAHATGSEGEASSAGANTSRHASRLTGAYMRCLCRLRPLTPWHRGALRLALHRAVLALAARADVARA
ncbi:hypothetical protein MRX96_053111 [Rhipicephalus microplus]